MAILLFWKRLYLVNPFSVAQASRLRPKNVGRRERLSYKSLQSSSVSSSSSSSPHLAFGSAARLLADLFTP